VRNSKITVHSQQCTGERNVEFDFSHVNLSLEVLAILVEQMDIGTFGFQKSSCIRTRLFRANNTLEISKRKNEMTSGRYHKNDSGQSE